MNDLEEMLAAIILDPLAEDRYLVLADWLEEHDDPRRAELLRLHRRLLATCCEPERHPDRAVWQARVVGLLREGIRPCVPHKVVLLGRRSKIPMTFSFIPPGSFLMGTPYDEEKRAGNEARHRVTLTKGFWFAVHPVTQAQWRRVKGRNPSQQFRDDDNPVDRVSWDDCQDFCRIVGGTGLPFRLPKEAEWEYACRSGTATPFFFGETVSTDQANYSGDLAYGKGTPGVCRRQPTPAGSFPPNAWGLFDLHGNVREWCQDRPRPYGGGDVADPAGPAEGPELVLRGGSWASHPASCRSGSRFAVRPGYLTNDIGCRVVMGLESQP